MQKFNFENGTSMIGRTALVDTMEDLIVDAIGAVIMSTIGYISLNACFRCNLLFNKLFDKIVLIIQAHYRSLTLCVV